MLDRWLEFARLEPYWFQPPADAVAGRQDNTQWLSGDAAARHLAQRFG